MAQSEIGTIRALLASRLEGFPATPIQVGSAETLLADATRFAAKAGEANVAVTLEI
jgi:monoterpene epsilon-lactone hydrolase